MRLWCMSQSRVLGTVETGKWQPEPQDADVEFMQRARAPPPPFPCGAIFKASKI